MTQEEDGHKDSYELEEEGLASLRSELKAIRERLKKPAPPNISFCKTVMLMIDAIVHEEDEGEFLSLCRAIVFGGETK